MPAKYCVDCTKWHPKDGDNLIEKLTREQLLEILGTRDCTAAVKNKIPGSYICAALNIQKSFDPRKK